MADVSDGQAGLRLSSNEQAFWNPTFGLDSQQRILFWSQAAEVTFGIPSSEAVGRTCYQVFEGRDYFGNPCCRRECPVFASLLSGHLRNQCALTVGGSREPVHRMKWTLLSLPPGSNLRALAFLQEPSPDLLDLAYSGHVSARLSAPFEPENLKGILSLVAEFTDMEVAELFLPDWQTGTMTLAEQLGPVGTAFRQITEFAPQQGFPGLVAAYREPIVSSDLSEDARFLRTKVKEAGFTDYICVPLPGPRAVQGVLGVASKRHHRNLGAATAALLGISRSLGTALSSAVLDARDSVADVPPNPTGDPLQGLEALLRHALHRMLTVSGASAGSVALRDPVSQKIVVSVHEGVERNTAGCPHATENTSSCPASSSLRTIALDGLRRTWPAACRENSPAAAPSLCLPLAIDGNSLGVVSLRFPDCAPMPATKYVGILSAMVNRTAALASGQLAYLRAWQAALAAERERFARSLTDTLSPTLLKHHGAVEGTPRISGEPDPQVLLDIRCFGDFRVCRNGTVLTSRAFERRQALTALKVLVASVGQKVPKDVLVECLWPDDSSGNGVARLHVVLNALRKAIEPAGRSPWLYIHTDGDAYYWNTEAPYRLDIQEFRDGIRKGAALEREGQLRQAIQSYEAAVTLYQGDFMHDEPYSDWFHTPRESYREQYIGLLRNIALLLDRQGDLAGARLYHQRALQVDPLSEELVRELMRSLWRLGRRDEALRQFTLFRNRLTDELEAGPLPETQQLFQTIMAASPF